MGGQRDGGPVTEEGFRLAFEQAPVGMALIGLDRRVLRVNAVFADLLDRSQDELLGADLGELTHPADRDVDRALVRDALDGRLDRYTLEKRYLRPDGEPVWVLVGVSLVRDHADRPWFFISQLQDISDRKRAEEQLLQLVLHDTLTGLPNGTLLQDRLEHALERAERAGRIVALLYCDVDRFKNVNDSLGHRAGDELLMEVANRFVSAVRPGDTVARLGGDEFVVLIEDLAASGTAFEVAHRVRQSLSAPLLVSGRTVHVSVSVGVALSEGAGSTPDLLLRNADAALYLAKESGRNRVELFAERLRVRALERIGLEAELREALTVAHLEPWFQPIFDLGRADVVGVEALVRWRHPVRGIMTPSSFLPLAEEAGLMDEVGAVVLDASLGRLQAWRRARPQLFLAWNLSPSELVSPGLLATVAEALQRWELPADALDVEVSEGTYSAIIGTALQVAAQLRRLGVGVTLDDFGTGYSSLAYLSRFPLDTVKVDRSFVAGIGNPTDETVLRAVLDLGELLGLRVVAEGVETEDQLAVVRSLGCRYVQGYLVSPPLPAGALDLDEVTADMAELLGAPGWGVA